MILNMMTSNINKDSYKDSLYVMHIMNIVYFLFLTFLLKSVGSFSLFMRKERNIAPIYRPITPNQKSYVESMEKSQISIGIGPAGTGKTLFACTHAIQQLKSQNVEKIIITRPVVPVEEDIGYLPGKLNSKMEPWTRPLFDIFQDYFEVKTVAQMLQCGTIEIAPLAYMRGRTFKNALIIADEMQNSSPNQMLMIVTRLGTRSQLLITGDLNQSDRMENNGLKDFLIKKELYDKYETSTGNIHITHFNDTDIQRSSIVTEVLKIYDYKPAETKPPTKPPTKNNDAAMIPLSDMQRLHP